MNLWDFRDNQEKTLMSLKHVSDDLYLLNYQNDYGLKWILDKGVKNIADLYLKVARYMFIPGKLMELDTTDFGCTSFNCRNSEGHHLLGRNFDFKKAPGVVTWTAPEDGYRSIAISDANFMLFGHHVRKLSKKDRPFNIFLAPYTMVDGMNEKGLAISVMEIKAKPVKQHRFRKTPAITTVLMRAALDTCTTVEEVVSLFEKYNMRDALGCCYHYQVIDKTGKSAILEYVNNKLRVIYPEDRLSYGVTVDEEKAENESSKKKAGPASRILGRGKTEVSAENVADPEAEDKDSILTDSIRNLISRMRKEKDTYEGFGCQQVTNFFLSPDGNNEKGFGYKRFLKVRNRLLEKEGILEADQAMDLLKECSVNTRHKYFRWKVITLWSAVYNTHEGTVDLCVGLNYDKKYHLDVNKPGEISEIFK